MIVLFGGHVWQRIWVWLDEHTVFHIRHERTISNPGRTGADGPLHPPNDRVKNKPSSPGHKSKAPLVTLLGHPPVNHHRLRMLPDNLCASRNGINQSEWKTRYLVVGHFRVVTMWNMCIPHRPIKKAKPAETLPVHFLYRTAFSLGGPREKYFCHHRRSTEIHLNEKNISCVKCTHSGLLQVKYVRLSTTESDKKLKFMPETGIFNIRKAMFPVSSSLWGNCLVACPTHINTTRSLAWALPLPNDKSATRQQM